MELPILTKVEYINDFLSEYGNEIDSWFVADINEIKWRLISGDYDDEYIMIKIKNAQSKNCNGDGFVHPKLDVFYRHLVNLSN